MQVSVCFTCRHLLIISGRINVKCSCIRPPVPTSIKETVHTYVKPCSLYLYNLVSLPEAKLELDGTQLLDVGHDGVKLLVLVCTMTANVSQ